MKRIFLDTNVVLDLALDRHPFAAEAQQIFDLLDGSELEAYISATTITDLYYIIRKSKSSDVAMALIESLLQILRIAGVDEAVVNQAIAWKWADFEDAIQAVAAHRQPVDFLITRNVDDFSQSSVTVLSPTEFLRRWDGG